MTFEEIHDAIVSGVPSTSAEDAEKDLDHLHQYGSNNPTLVALRLAEDRAFRKNDPGFLAEARARWNFKGEKTIFHCIGAGNVLLSLRDFKASGNTEKENRAIEAQARKCYTLCVSIEETKLEALASLCSVMRKKGKNDTVELINYLKLHFQKEWTVRELKQNIAELYCLGGNKKDKEQLTFSFFDAIEDDAIADLMEQDSFNTTSAMTMVYNGTLLCRNANSYLEKHAADIDDDELDQFEEISSALAEAKAGLDSLLEKRKRKQLMIP